MNNQIKKRRQISNTRVLPVTSVKVIVMPKYFQYALIMATTSLLIYLLLVMSIIFATTERKAFEEKISKVRTELSYKEVKYGKELAVLGISKAHEIGFVDVVSPYYTNTEATALILRSE